MSVITTTHLNFRTEARPALEFYQSVFGGEAAIVTYGMVDPEASEAASSLVLWGQVQASNGFHVMAFDVPDERPFDRGIDSAYVSVRGDSEEEIRTYWAALTEGATIRADLGPAGFSPLYGMLTDRFGITWVLDVAA